MPSRLSRSARGRLEPLQSAAHCRAIVAHLPSDAASLDEGGPRSDAPGALTCLQRAARPDDSLPSNLGLAALGPGLRLGGARRVAEAGGMWYWVVPTDDGQGVMFFGADEHAGRGGIAIFTSLAERGAAAHLEVRRGRWWCALLVVDGFERVRAGTVESAVADNFAVLDLDDRPRVVRLLGPVRSRDFDLGPSDLVTAAARAADDLGDQLDHDDQLARRFVDLDHSEVRKAEQRLGSAGSVGHVRSLLVVAALDSRNDAGGS